jgi:hypothetical protein
MPWGFAIGGALGAVGSVIAGHEQAGAQQQAANTQQNMFNQIAGYETPFRQAGVGATNRLSTLLGTGGSPNAPGYGSLTSSFTPQDYLRNQDPGYQFQLQTGGQALRNQDTPGIGALSGAALKDLMGFNQGMAATGYQNAFNRFTTQQNNIFGRLSGLAGMGQNAASNTGTAGTQLGTGIAQAQAAAGGSTAGGIVGASNALGSGSSLLGAYLNSGYNQTNQANQGINLGSSNTGGSFNNADNQNLYQTNDEWLTLAHPSLRTLM